MFTFCFRPVVYNTGAYMALRKMSGSVWCSWRSDYTNTHTHARRARKGDFTVYKVEKEILALIMIKTITFIVLIFVGSNRRKAETYNSLAHVCLFSITYLSLSSLMLLLHLFFLLYFFYSSQLCAVFHFVARILYRERFPFFEHVQQFIVVLNVCVCICIVSWF